MFLIIFFIKTIIADSALTNSMQSRTLLAFENKQQNLWLNYTLRTASPAQSQNFQTYN